MLSCVSLLITTFFAPLQFPTDSHIAMHMKNIYDTLAGIQSQLISVDERLSLIEGNIFNIGMTTPQPGPSFSSPDVTLSSLPADCSELNLQVPVETTLPLQSLDWSPDMQITTPKQSSKRSTANSNSSVSPLVSHLPPEVANKVKKVKRTDRKSFTRGCMDVLFSTEEMATSNVDGKRNKDKLDEKRVDLVKRKQIPLLIFICLFFVYLLTSLIRITILAGFNRYVHFVFLENKLLDYVLQELDSAVGVVLKLGVSAWVHFCPLETPPPPLNLR